MRRDRAVVDDPAAHRLLVLHDLEGFLGAQERAGEDRVDDRLPALESQFLDRRRRAEAGIVEQDVEPSESFLGAGEQRPDRVGIADIGRHTERLYLQALDLADDRLQRLRPAAGDDDGEALLGERDRRRLADPASSTGDEGDFPVRAHAESLLLREAGTIPVWLSPQDENTASLRYDAAHRPGARRQRAWAVGRAGEKGGAHALGDLPATFGGQAFHIGPDRPLPAEQRLPVIAEISVFHAD